MRERTKALTAALLMLTFASDLRAQPAPEQGAAVTVYEAQFFAPFSVDNAFDMIARLPGFQFDGGDQVRGLAGAGGNVLIGGQRPASKNDSLENILKRIPASEVLLIEVIRGGAPGVDMQGKSVVANIKRRAAGGVSGLVEIGATAEVKGRIDRHLRLEARKSGDRRVLEGALSVNDFRGDGEGEGPRVRLDDTGATIIESQNTGFFKSTGPSFNGSAALETPLLGGKLRFNAAANGMYRSEGYTDVLVVPGSVETLIDLGDTLEGELGAHYARALGARTSGELIVLARAAENKFESAFEALSPARTSTFRLKKRSSELVGRTTVKHEALPVLSVEAGGEIALNTLRSNTDLAIDGAPIALSAANVTVKEERGEVFSSATWRAAPFLTLEGGVRIEGSAISSEGDVTLSKTLSYVKPRLAAAIDFPGRTQLRLRAEHEVDQLAFEDFAASSSLGASVVVAGNPDLNPERAVTLEAVVEKRFARDGAFVARYTRQALDDVTDFAPAVSSSGVASVKANIGQGEAEEFALALTMPLGWIGVTGGLLKPSATWRESTITDPTTGLDRRRSNESPFSWSVAFSQDSPIWPLVWGVTVTGDEQTQLYRVSEVTTTKRGVFLEAFADIKLPEDWALRIDLRNLTRRETGRWRDVYVGPRSDDDLDYVDVRRLHESHEMSVRIRKRF